MLLKPGTLRFEITLALLIKLLLLTGLWFLVFRWPGRPPAPRADIAERFQLPGVQGRPGTADAPSHHPSQEPPHVR